MSQYEVFEEIGVRQYLQKRGLIEVYREKKANFKAGRLSQIKLKRRQPKNQRVFQFRITQKYRAYGYFKEENTFIVTEISDHQ